MYISKNTHFTNIVDLDFYMFSKLIQITFVVLAAVAGVNSSVMVSCHHSS